MPSLSFVASAPLHTSSSRHCTSSLIGRTSFKSATIFKRGRALSQSHALSVRALAEGGIQDKLAWVDAVEISQVAVGNLLRVVLAGLDICIACDYDGQVYALGNKGPPLGVPLSDGSIVEEDGKSYLQCPQYGTLFDLSTGKVKDASSWIRSPPLVSNILRLIFSEPSNVPVFSVRESGDMLQVMVNMNARAQYEQDYWKGLLDASGKADGGYY